MESVQVGAFHSKAFKCLFSYNDYGWFWIPILGPFIGALIGGWIYEIVVGFQVIHFNLIE
jgi:glycerol uptake facilitator-like aquaporin